MVSNPVVIDVEAAMLEEAFRTQSAQLEFIFDSCESLEIQSFLSNIHCSELALYDQYWVAGVMCIPITNTIIISTLCDATLTGASAGELLFSKESTLFRYPEAIRLAEYQLQSNLMFDSEIKLNQFITLFQLKFSNWQIFNKAL